MKKLGQHRGQKGLSLVEVLISLAILSVGVFAVVDVIPFAFKINSSNWKATQVMYIAQKTLDEEQAKGIQSTSIVRTDPIMIKGSQVGTVKTWRTTDPEGSPNMQVVNVEVNWAEQGRNKRCRLVGYVGWPY